LCTGSRGVAVVAGGAGVGALGVEAIGDGEIDLENAELKHVTRHRPVDVNGPGQDVPTGAAVSDFAADSADIFGHGTRRNDARSVNLLRIGPAHGLYDDDVTGIDGQHRFERRAEMSDVDRLRAGHQRVFGGERIG
jgi:hypothetical protein